MAKDTTATWNKYKKGLDYHARIKLVPTINKCERFYAGDQWAGLQGCENLPTPVINVLKRVINHKISQVMSNALKMQFRLSPKDMINIDPMMPPEMQEQAKIEHQKQLEKQGEMFNLLAEAKWEKLKMDTMLEKVLKDGAIKGSGCLYFPWDETIQEALGVQGDFTVEKPDNVNVFFGNPNDPRVNVKGKPVQPYILIAFRELVDNLKEEAKRNGRPKDEIDRITGDNEYQDQSGDMSQIELEDASKCICLLMLRYDRKTRTIWAEKATKYTVIREEWDTGRKLYPVSWFNWEERDNCYQGTPESKEIIPNQIAINKTCAMLIISIAHYSYPKIVYNSSFIDGEPDNSISTPIAVSGGNNLDEVIKYIQPSQPSTAAFTLLETIIRLTKEMMGANEAALGEVKPENTSAFIAINQASIVPLESVRRRLFQFVEDIAYIWLDYWLTDYNSTRALTLKKGNEYSTEYAKLSEYQNMMFDVKIDVGPSNQWSEIESIQTLDALLDKGQITLRQYLERLPNGVMPKKQELLDEVEQQEQMQQQMQEAQMQMQPQENEAMILDKYMQMLPPELQQAVAEAIQIGMTQGAA